MNCLHCGDAIPQPLLDAVEARLSEHKGMFRCPACRTQHVRRVVGVLPSGVALYGIRLWGHMTKTRRKLSATPLVEKRTRLKWRSRPAAAEPGAAP